MRALPSQQSARVPLVGQLARRSEHEPQTQGLAQLLGMLARQSGLDELRAMVDMPLRAIEAALVAMEVANKVMLRASRIHLI